MKLTTQREQLQGTLVQLTKKKTVQCNAYFTINAKYYEKIKKNKLNIQIDVQLYKQ